MVNDLNDVATGETMLDFHEHFADDYMFRWLHYELWLDYKVQRINTHFKSKIQDYNVLITKNSRYSCFVDNISNPDLDTKTIQ